MAVVGLRLIHILKFLHCLQVIESIRVLVLLWCLEALRRLKIRILERLGLLEKLRIRILEWLKILILGLLGYLKVLERLRRRSLTRRYPIHFLVVSV